MPERQGRYSEAERQQFAANRRKATAGAKYGTSFEAQGYRPQKDQGQAFLNRMALQQKYGAFANPTWDYEERGGVLYRRPKPGQTGRIAEQGGTAQWEAAPDYVQRAYQNPERRAFNAAHPELAGTPGGGRDQFLYSRFTSRLETDPVTGLKVNKAGELYDPNVMGGGSIGNVGQRPDQGGVSWEGPAPFPGGPGQPFGYGGYGQPGGYIPGYAQPWGMPGYGMPQYGGGNLGALGGGNMYQGGPSMYQPQAPGINPVNYRTLQQGGGSSFGTYQPQWGSGSYWGR